MVVLAWPRGHAHLRRAAREHHARRRSVARSRPQRLRAGEVRARGVQAGDVLRLVSSQRLIEERQHSGVSFRVIRFDQGRSAPDRARGDICQIVGLLYIPDELESGSYQCTERAPLACRRIRWVYLSTTFIHCECAAAPLTFVCNEHASSFDNVASNGHRHLCLLRPRRTRCNYRAAETVTGKPPTHRLGSGLDG